MLLTCNTLWVELDCIVGGVRLQLMYCCTLTFRELICNLKTLMERSVDYV